MTKAGPKELACQIELFTDSLVVLVRGDFEKLQAEDAFNDPYGWGHGGPIYLDERVVHVVDTIGM
jgi:hypothetical protein